MDARNKKLTKNPLFFQPAFFFSELRLAGLELQKAFKLTVTDFYGPDTLLPSTNSEKIAIWAKTTS